MRFRLAPCNAKGFIHMTKQRKRLLGISAILFITGFLCDIVFKEWLVTHFLFFKAIAPYGKGITVTLGAFFLICAFHDHSPARYASTALYTVLAIITCDVILAALGFGRFHWEKTVGSLVSGGLCFFIAKLYSELKKEGDSI